MDFTTELRALGVEIVALARSGLNIATTAVPAVAREAAMYWTIMAVIKSVVLPIIITALTVGACACYKRASKIANYKSAPEGEEQDKLYRLYREDAEIPQWIASMACALSALILSVTFLFSSLPDVIKAFAAPSLFFIEHAAELFK